MPLLDTLQAHRLFAGNRDHLAGKAVLLKEELGLSGDGPNVRIIRHYEQVGCVSKPFVNAELQGVTGDIARNVMKAGYEKSPFNIYAYRHLLEVTAVRVLLQDGWRLERIAEYLVTSTDDDAIEQIILTRGRFAGLETAAGYSAASSPLAAPETAKGALELIAGFKQQAGVPKALPAVPARSLAPRPIAEYQPASWLRITIDEEAKRKAGSANVARTLAEATAILASLNI